MKAKLLRNRIENDEFLFKIIKFIIIFFFRSSGSKLKTDDDMGNEKIKLKQKKSFASVTH